MAKECCKDWCMGKDMMPGMGKRVAVSIIVGVGWLIFVILFLAFWTGGFSLLQCIAIFIVSILAMAVILGPMWASWGMRMAAENKELRKCIKKEAAGKK